MDIADWLRGLGLAQYAQDFQTHDVDGAVLRSLTAEDLRDIGVASVGHRRILVNAIAALSAIKTPDAVDPPEKRPVSASLGLGQRRPVTVLFADLSGFTQLSGELEDEALHTIVSRYLAMAGEAVRECGGVVDKQIGDAVRAVVGAPVATNEDVPNAARAALKILAGMGALSEACGRPLDAHVGLAVGEAIVGGMGGSPHNAIGASVNLAARITAAAKAGEALVSDGLARQLSDGFRLEDRGSFAAKGVNDPVRVWRLVAELSGARAPHPFVGRSAELEQIATVLDRSLASRTGAVVHVRGEPGIGKSRLVAQAAELAQARGFKVLVTHALEFGAGHARHPLRTLASSLLGLPRGADTRGRAATIAKRLSELRLLPLGEPFVLELADAELSVAQRSVLEAIPDDKRQAEREAAIATLVAQSAKARPLVLAVEDVHWADDLLSGAILRLLPVAECQPLVLLTASRPDNDRLLAAIREASRYTLSLTLDLGPLRPDEAAEAAGAFDVPTDVRRICIERAAGHPLFLDQLLRNADERVRAEVPPSLRTLILARIDRLAEADRRMIEAASALGERFDPDALRHILGLPRIDLSGLMRTGMLRHSGRDAAFGHALIRDATYRSLLKETRQALHRSAAEWFADRDVILHAVHLKEAGSPEAAVAYRRAAEDRLARYRPQEALDLVSAALGLGPAPGERGELVLLRASILLDLGRSRDAAAAFEEGISAGLADKSQCSARIGLASAQRVLDNIPAALGHLEIAQDLAARNDWPVLLSRCHNLRGNLLFPTGQVDRCYAEHRLAVETAERSGDQEAIARALGGLGDAEYVRGCGVSAGQCFRRCVEASVEAGLGRIEAANRPMATYSTLCEMRFREGLAEAETAIGRARLFVMPRAELIGRHMQASALMELGRDEEALPVLEEARRITRELEAWRFDAENLAFTSEIHIRAGRIAEAREALETALGIARSTGISYFGGIVLADLARTEPDAAAREAILAELETVLASAVSHNHWIGRRQLMELGWELKDPRMIEFHAAALEAYCKAEIAPILEVVIRRGRALACVLRGEKSGQLSGEIAALKAIAEASGSRLLLNSLE